jgi:hypothetical protein
MGWKNSSNAVAAIIVLSSSIVKHAVVEYTVVKHS